MTRRYRSEKRIPADRLPVQMITPADPVSIPFSIRINETDLKGVISPDMKLSETDLPNEFIVFLFGTQPFRLLFTDGEWQLDGPTEYQGLADDLGYVVMAWYE